MLPRRTAARLLDALRDRPVVFLTGARQCGKSTLARAIASAEHPGRYLTFDSLATLASARTDPEGFLRSLDGAVVLDEVQRCPELLLPIKAAVDNDREPGRFLLTGSTSVLVLPQIADALVGRVEILVLRPLSQSEIDGRTGNLVDALFADELLKLDAGATSEADLAARIRRGGFPEAVAMEGPERRAAWFDSYITTLLQRDVRDLAQIEKLPRLPDLARLLATRVGTLLNLSELSRATQLSQSTLRRYLALLEGVYLVSRVPAWSSNLGKRLVKSPKLYFGDTGLAAHLVGADLDEAPTLPEPRGALLENFVWNELDKEASWSRTRPRIHHYRSHGGAEVDFVLEDARGRCVGVEVKASSRVAKSDFRWLDGLQSELGERWVRSVLLHTGTETLPFGPASVALPVSALWRARGGTTP